MSAQFSSVKQALNLPVGCEIVLRGWVRSRRDSKGVTFIELNDGSRFKSMQLVVEAGAINDETLKQVTTGSSIEAIGQLVASPAKGQAVELKVTAIQVYGSADPATYPLQKKGHTLEFLREISHLRVRSNTFGAAFRVRNALTHAIHLFFQERDFLYVQTPVITTSDCEGAGQMFNVTTLNMQQPPRTADGKVDWQQDFFAKPAYLTVSGQLEGEIFASAFSKVYTFGPTFRAENSNTPRHLAEFWMIEPEMAFYQLNDNMRLAEEFLKYIIRYVLEQCREDLEFFNQFIEKSVLATLEHGRRCFRRACLGSGPAQLRFYGFFPASKSGIESQSHGNVLRIFSFPRRRRHRRADRRSLARPLRPSASDARRCPVDGRRLFVAFPGQQLHRLFDRLYGTHFAHTLRRFHACADGIDQHLVYSAARSRDDHQ